MTSDEQLATDRQGRYCVWALFLVLLHAKLTGPVMPTYHVWFWPLLLGFLQGLVNYVIRGRP